jgi:hypothetical protein
MQRFLRQSEGQMLWTLWHLRYLSSEQIHRHGEIVWERLPKSGRQREVPLNAKAIAVLKRHRHLRSELVFCGAEGGIRTR